MLNTLHILDKFHIGDHGQLGCAVIVHLFRLPQGLMIRVMFKFSSVVPWLKNSPLTSVTNK